MPSGTENIILFPKWRKELEKQSLQDLQQKKYKQALIKLNKLLDYHVNNHEVVFGKLICLMELGHYEEAISLCEALIEDKTENHYHYVHVYLTILFQTSQYSLLMEHIENELADEKIPSTIKEQFMQLYNLSKQMNNDIIRKESNENYIELTEAINNEDYKRQWQLLENLRKMKVDLVDEVIPYLVEERIHPVTKTVIFKWMQDQQISYPVEVHKFGIISKEMPSDVPKIRSHLILKQILLSINDIEQDNPSLYILLEQILYRYLYVRYPVMPVSSEVEHIGEALKYIGHQYLHIVNNNEISKEVAKCIKEIQECEQLYLSIIEE